MKAPERIYLIDQGDDGIVWCDDPNPAGDVEPPESVEYMRVPPRTEDWREDRGPWHVAEDAERVWLFSADFHHDVRLYVNGDFSTHGDMLAYAQSLAESLNKVRRPEGV